MTINQYHFDGTLVRCRDSEYEIEPLRLLLRRTGKAQSLSTGHPCNLSHDITKISSEWYSIFGRWIRNDWLYGFRGIGKTKFYFRKRVKLNLVTRKRRTIQTICSMHHVSPVIPSKSCLKFSLTQRTMEIFEAIILIGSLCILMIFF
jgi:hypothetical protein